MVTTRPWMKTGLMIGVGLVWLFSNVPAVAARDLQGSRSLGMGGTLRAAPSGETAVLLNPAGMSLFKNYIINALYQYRASDEGSLVNVSVVDSATKRIAAGIYYNFIYGSPQRTIASPIPGKAYSLSETLETHEAGMALAYPIGQSLHLGVTTKYYNVSVEQPDDTPVALQRGGASGVTMDAGLIFKLLPQLNIAVTGHNLIPVDSENFPRLLGMGVSYAFGTTFLAEFDTVLDFDGEEDVNASYHGGAELFFLKHYSIRGGVIYDQSKEATYFTVGGGLIISKFAVDFGMRQMVDGGGETLMAFSLRYFVQ